MIEYQIVSQDAAGIVTRTWPARTPEAHTHVASEITSGELAIARIPTGATSSTVCIGNDSRLSDARTPTSHVHGNISNVGAIGSTADLIVGTGASGILETKTASQSRIAIGVNTAAVNCIVDGNDAVIAVGAVKGHVYIPFDCTITGWEIVASESGDMVVDIWKDTFANYPPLNVSDSITGTAKPTLTASDKATSTTLTDWVTSLNEGDYLKVEVESNSAITWFTLVLRVTRA